MALQYLMLVMKDVTLEKDGSNAMAVPKKRRSKAKGKTRLANWKRKTREAAKKALNIAKGIFSKKEKKKVDEKEK